MIASGYLPEIVELVTKALLNKNSNTASLVSPPFTPDDSSEVSSDERLLRHLIRLADSIEVTRVRTIPKGFPKPEPISTQLPCEHFDVRQLDIDPELCGNHKFMSDFYALMECSLDLAGVSGGYQRQDLRDKPSYAEVHGLINLDTVSKTRKRWLECCASPTRTLDTWLDNNVRREIVRKAGLTICSDHELAQVPLPDNLALVDKFLLKQPAVQYQLAKQAKKINERGIYHGTGTLTQKLLGSKKVQAVLKSNHGIGVKKYERFGGLKQPREALNVITRSYLQPFTMANLGKQVIYNKNKTLSQWHVTAHILLAKLSVFYTAPRYHWAVAESMVGLPVKYEQLQWH